MNEMDWRRRDAIRGNSGVVARSATAEQKRAASKQDNGQSHRRCLYDVLKLAQLRERRVLPFSFTTTAAIRHRRRIH